MAPLYGLTRGRQWVTCPAERRKLTQLPPGSPLLTPAHPRRRRGLAAPDKTGHRRPSLDHHRPGNRHRPTGPAQDPAAGPGDRRESPAP